VDVERRGGMLLKQRVLQRQLVSIAVELSANRCTADWVELVGTVV
jgi:hypothetical protein